MKSWWNADRVGFCLWCLFWLCGLVAMIGAVMSAITAPPCP